MSIEGIGVDVVDLDRFAETLRRSPGLRDRLFTPAERSAPVTGLAAAFAAKEAVAKALGVPGGLSWHDVEVTHDGSGRPWLQVTDARWGDLRWHLSLSHDGGVAVAMVVAER